MHAFPFNRAQRNSQTSLFLLCWKHRGQTVTQKNTHFLFLLPVRNLTHACFWVVTRSSAESLQNKCQNKGLCSKIGIPKPLIFCFIRMQMKSHCAPLLTDLQIYAAETRYVWDLLRSAMSRLKEERCLLTQSVSTQSASPCSWSSRARLMKPISKRHSPDWAPSSCWCLSAFLSGWQPQEDSSNLRVFGTKPLRCHAGTDATMTIVLFLYTKAALCKGRDSD